MFIFPAIKMKPIIKKSLNTDNFPGHHRVLIVRPSEAQAREPYNLYLSRIIMEFQNSFFKYKLWGFSSFSFFQEKRLWGLAVTGSDGRLIRPEVKKISNRKSKNIFLKSL